MKENRNVIQVLQKPFSLIYPRRCPICHDVIPLSEGLTCSGCLNKPVRILDNFCMKCGKSLAGPDLEYCMGCRKKKHVFDRGRALFRYDDIMRASIGAFKYHGRREYKDFYARELYIAFEKQVAFWHPEVVIPVPLHRTRRKERGYNQAELVAKAFARYMDLRVDTQLLQRCKKTLPQKGLDYQQRAENMKTAFKISADVVKYKRILLMDDIYTTGSTMDAAARILKQKGAQSVYFLCISIGSSN